MKTELENQIDLLKSLDDLIDCVLKNEEQSVIDKVMPNYEKQRAKILRNIAVLEKAEEERKSVTITINKDIYSEFERIVRLHKQHGAPNAHETPESLINYVLCAVADGSRRPGAWERQMLQMMGIVAECDDHEIYQSEYGAE